MGNVALSILIESLAAFGSSFDPAACAPASKTTFWKKRRKMSKAENLLGAAAFATALLVGMSGLIGCFNYGLVDESFYYDPGLHESADHYHELHNGHLHHIGHDPCD